MSTTRETTTATTARVHEKVHERDWLEPYFSFVKRIEAPVVRTTARMAGVVAEYVPERPAFLAALPKVHDVMATGITMRKRMVDEQTRFARQMMKAMDPMLVRVDTVHVEPASPAHERAAKHEAKHDKQEMKRPVRRTPEPAPKAMAHAS